ncbi:MAG: tagatose-6-phosphate kinase [Spirochaetales bacterium]|nr:tagatose-6-phosphate kinase [Spirochaetales bacterium]
MTKEKSNARFLVVCLNPTIQRTLVFDSVELGQVNRAKIQRVDASGKGVNAARVLVQLGARVHHLTQIGGEDAKTFVNLTLSDGIRLHGVPGAEGIRTCTTLIDRSNLVVTELVEEGRPVSPEIEKALVRSFHEILKDVDSVILTGSKAPGFSSKLYPEFVAEAKERGKAVFLDYRGQELLDTLHFQPDCVKINVSEFASTVGVRLPENIDPAEIPNEVFERLKELANVTQGLWVLTNGAKPTCYVFQGILNWKHHEAPKVVNSIGSGDSVLAGIAYGRTEGRSIEESIDLGIRCGVANLGVLKPGSIFD